MSTTAFDQLIAEAVENDEMNLVGGYYLASTSSHTAELYKVYPEVVKASLSMEVGKYSQVQTGFGVCFIYKDDIESSAYLENDYEIFFGDFFADAASYIYKRELEGYFGDVKIKDKFYDINLIELPYNYNLIANFE